MFQELEEHRGYLADARRTEAYTRALGELVTSHSAVLDLGAGTGILGLLACRAGARKVYALDGGSIIELARRIAEANGWADRIEHRQALSTEAQLPEFCDLIVADQIGRFGLECGLWQTLHDAGRRLLKPGGRCIPEALTLHAAPAEAPNIWSAATDWPETPAGFDFSSARSVALNTPWPVDISSSQLLSEPASSRLVRLQNEAPETLRLEAEFQAVRGGTLHGIAGWFSARLSPSVTMSNSPLDERRIARQQLLFPIAQPVALEAGDRIVLALTLQPLENVITWNVAVHAAQASPVFAHSTFLAQLVSRDEWACSRPDAVPMLSETGAARCLALELCDGIRTVAAIEAELARRFPQLFPSPREASAFVVETILRYRRQ